MTKEELEKEAVESAEKFFGKPTDLVDLDNLRIFKNGYLAGAEPREKRIAELEHQLTHRNCLDCSNHSSKLRMRTLKLEKENEELKSENQKWKDEWQEQVQKATDEGYARTLQTIQLNNAKEIIREFVEWATWQGNSKCPSFKSIQDKFLHRLWQALERFFYLLSFKHLPIITLKICTKESF